MERYQIHCEIQNHSLPTCQRNEPLPLHNNENEKLNQDSPNDTKHNVNIKFNDEPNINSELQMLFEHFLLWLQMLFTTQLNFSWHTNPA